MSEPEVRVGQVYADRDALSRYRCQVEQINQERLYSGRSIQLRNLSTGRLHWTSLHRLAKAYRRIK
jgi:hypothetical protein